MYSDGLPYEKRADAKSCEGKPVCIADEVPFEVPEGWAWVRLGSICNSLAGFAFPSSEFKRTGRYRLLRGINLAVNSTRWDNTVYIDEMPSKAETYRLKSGDLLLGMDRPWINDGLRTAILNDADDTYLVQRVLRFRSTSALRNCYLKLFLDSPMFTASLHSSTTGISVPHISESQVCALLVPLPPLIEQLRIVAKVEQLTPLVDEYGALEDEREALDTALPESLRRSVLQQAVEGKLVEQDPADEPAGALLERIRDERRQLVADGKLKAPKGGESVIYRASDGRRYEKRIDKKGRGSEPICIEDEIPFEVPDSWEWARLESLGTIVGGGTPKTSINEYWADDEDGIPWITPADMSSFDGLMVKGGKRYITEKGLASSSAQLLPAGSVLMSSRAPIGYLGIADRELCTNQGFKSVDLINKKMNLWVLVVLEALMDDIKRRASGTTFKEISGTEFGRTLVPLPPLTEQRRIVERVQVLFEAIA